MKVLGIVIGVKRWQEKYADKHRQASQNPVIPGDKVLLKNSKTLGKLDPKFENKPYFVQTKEGQEVTVKSDEGVIYRRNNSFVKPYQEPEVQETTTESEKSEDTVVAPTVVAPTAEDTPVAEAITRPSRTRRLPGKLKDFVLNTVQDNSDLRI